MPDKKGSEMQIEKEKEMIRGLHFAFGVSLSSAIIMLLGLFGIPHELVVPFLFALALFRGGWSLRLYLKD